MEIDDSFHQMDFLIRTASLVILGSLWRESHY